MHPGYPIEGCGGVVQVSKGTPESLATLGWDCHHMRYMMRAHGMGQRQWRR